MPNQYNAAITGDVPEKSRSLNFGDGYPIPSASGTTGNTHGVPVATAGFFPSTSAAIVNEFRADAAATPETQDRNPKPSASGVTGGATHAVPVTGAFNAGTGASAVVDFRGEATFVTPSGMYGGMAGTDPNRELVV
jgi:hypothetical protein